MKMLMNRLNESHRFFVDKSKDYVGICFRYYWYYPIAYTKFMWAELKG